MTRGFTKNRGAYSFKGCKWLGGGMKWRACKDALPEKEGLYLIYAPSCDAESPMIVVVSYRFEEGWIGLVPIWLEAITHWMPLPDPPAVPA